MSISPIPKTLTLNPVLPPDTSIKIIGLGGVGSIAARYGSLLVASLGSETRLVLVDGDAFEFSNSNRMLFGAYGNKAAVVREELLPRCSGSTLSVVAIEEYVTPNNVGRLIRDGDIILLTVDNHATRKLVNDHCSRLEEVCLISGGNDGVGRDAAGNVRRGTYGNVQLYLRREGADVTPPLTRHHPEIELPADHLPGDLSCTDLVAAVPQILFANLAVASAMLNALWLHLCGALHYGELAFDIADGLMRPVSPLSTLVGIVSPDSKSNPVTPGN